MRLVDPLKSSSGLDNREGSSPVEDGATGVVEGRFIRMKYQKSKCEIGMQGGATNKMALLGSAFLVLVLIQSGLERPNDVVLGENEIGVSKVYIGRCPRGVWVGRGWGI